MTNSADNDDSTSGSDASLAELVARARNGDDAAIREILSQFEGEVRMMVRGRLPRKLRTQFDSMDFVQAVWQSFFVDLKDRSKEFENVQHLRGFLDGVARNKVFEQHRRLTKTEKYTLAREERLYVRRGDRDVAREVVSPEPTPSQAFQVSDRLAQLTEGCTPRDVEILTLRYEGLTLDEIAARTGMNERSVRRIIDAARARMEAKGWR